jgi:hypothetical protein
LNCLLYRNNITIIFDNFDRFFFEELFQKKRAWACAVWATEGARRRSQPAIPGFPQRTIKEAPG